MAQTKQQKQVLKATSAGSSKLSMDDFVDLLNSPKRLGWLNFYAGIMRGAGIVLGGAVILVLIGAAVNYLGAIPVIGQFINKIAVAAQITNP